MESHAFADLIDRICQRSGPKIVSISIVIYSFYGINAQLAVVNSIGKSDDFGGVDLELIMQSLDTI